MKKLVLMSLLSISTLFIAQPTQANPFAGEPTISKLVGSVVLTGAAAGGLWIAACCAIAKPKTVAGPSFLLLPVGGTALSGAFAYACGRSAIYLANSAINDFRK